MHLAVSCMREGQEFSIPVPEKNACLCCYTYLFMYVLLYFRSHFIFPWYYFMWK